MNSSHCSRCVCVCVCVCVLGWVKYREHILVLVILCIIVYVTKKKVFCFVFPKPISDYGKMLKYREKYRSISNIKVTFSQNVLYHMKHNFFCRKLKITKKCL